MWEKEEGYDEFLAEKIRIGREQIAAGQGIPFEEAKKHWLETLERKKAEMEAFEREVAYG